MKKIITLLIVIGMLVLSGCSSDTDNLAAEIEQLKSQIVLLTNENNNLKNDITELESIIDNQNSFSNDDVSQNDNEQQYPLYSDWIEAESSRSERDMYEAIISGFEIADDEISRGWLDDATLKFIRLIKGDDLSKTATTSQVLSAYRSLRTDIEHTTYCIRDFFTSDKYGSTNAGIYNFFETIDQLEDERFNGRNLIDINSSGNVVGFDFDKQEVADVLGISVELVGILTHAAVDAGFNITFDGYNVKA